MDGTCRGDEASVGMSTDWQFRKCVSFLARAALLFICYAKVICGVCHPWSGHLYQRLGTAMTLTQDFCDDFYTACSGQLTLSDTYCDFHAGEGDEDLFYAYPYVADGKKRSSNIFRIYEQEHLSGILYGVLHSSSFLFQMPPSLVSCVVGAARSVQKILWVQGGFQDGV